MSKGRANGKLKPLLEVLSSMVPAAVALSGGTDSSLLAAAAFRAHKGSVAITVDDATLPRSELADAKKVARLIGIRHITIKIGARPKAFFANDARRCYYCKKQTFGRIREAATELGIKHVLDGTNADDIYDFRPGMRAAREEGVRFPLLEAGMGKSDVRKLAKSLSLPVWDKPASACLASRIQRGMPITKRKLSRIEAAEEFLKRKFGVRLVRVRDHGNLARIQFSRSEMRRLREDGGLAAASRRLKSLGYKFVCMDADGYVRGS